MAFLILPASKTAFFHEPALTKYTTGQPNKQCKLDSLKDQQIPNTGITESKELWGSVSSIFSCYCLQL